MDRFNPFYEDGYFKALLDIKEFLSGSGVKHCRGVKIQRTYINSFVGLLLKDVNARNYYRLHHNIGHELNKDGSIKKWFKI